MVLGILLQRGSVVDRKALHQEPDLPGLKSWLYHSLAE